MSEKPKSRDILNKLTIVIFVLLILLTFLSRSIASAMQPTVETVTYTSAQLPETLRCVGKAIYEKKTEVKLGAPLNVLEVYVMVGDVISENDVLCKLDTKDMDYNIEAIDRNLANIKINRDKLALDIENINMQIAKINRYAEELSSETADADEVSYDDLIQLERDITRAEENYEKQKMLYEAGALPKQQLDDALTNIGDLRENYERQKKSLEKNVQKTEKQIQDENKSKERQLQDYSDDIQSYMLQLKAKDLEIQSLALQEETALEERDKLREKYPADGLIIAPCDGTVSEVFVEEGRFAEDVLFTLVPKGTELCVQFSMSADDALLYEIGYPVQLFFTDRVFIMFLGFRVMPSSKSVTLQNKTFDPETQKYVYTIPFENTAVSEGQEISVSVQKPSSAYGIVLPKGAVFSDSYGSYIYLVKERDGLWGHESYVQQKYVTVVGGNKFNVALQLGTLTPDDKVVSSSTGSLSTGQAVKVSETGELERP